MSAHLRLDSVMQAVIVVNASFRCPFVRICDPASLVWIGRLQNWYHLSDTIGYDGLRKRMP